MSIRLQGPDLGFSGVDKPYPGEQVAHRQAAPGSSGCVCHKDAPEVQQVAADEALEHSIGQAGLQDGLQLSLVSDGRDPDL